MTQSPLAAAPAAHSGLLATTRFILPALLFAVLMTAAVEPAVSQQSGATADRQGRSAADPELAIRHYRRGNTYNNLERYEEALNEYRLSVAADPTFAESYRNLANIYYHLGRYGEAIPMLSRFISLQPESGEPSAPLIAAVKTLGQLLRSEERYEEALPYDLRALQIDPADRSQVHLMGNAYNNAGHADKAIQVYQRALEVQPNDAFLYRTLGRLYDQEERLEEALSLYREAAERDADSAFYRELVETTEERLAEQAQR